MKESKVVTIVGGYHMLIGIFALLSLVRGGTLNINGAVLSAMSDFIIRIVVVFVYLPVGFIYLKRIRLSNWALLASLFAFFGLGIYFTADYNWLYICNNLIYLLFAVIVTVVRRKEFANSIKNIFARV